MMAANAQSYLHNGRYQVLDKIGEGGMGSVYRALDTTDGTTVAIKELKQELVISEPAYLERFRREGNALRQLNHPNIVNMLETFEESGCHYIVMEYVNGGSLRDLLLEEAALPLDRAMSIALDLADALTRAHHLQIIHRDLKPANILLSEDDTTRLTDFGVAHVADSNITQTGSVVGTVAYLSPEACSGGIMDRGGDIWAFGVILFEMLAGRRPFDAQHPAGVLNAILFEPLPDLKTLRPDAPDELVMLVNNMLERDPAKRIQSVRLVGAQLEAIMRGLDSSPYVLPRPPRQDYTVADESRFATPTPYESEADMLVQQVRTAAPASGRRWGRWIALGAAILVILAAVGIMLVVESRRPATVIVEPVEPGQYMVLVAELEPLGAAQRDVTRFIVDDLQQNLEVSVPFSTIRIRRYPEIISSEGQARAVAEANQASVIVWGNYTDARVELDIEIGVTTGFDHIQVPREMIDRIANVRVHLTDEDVQSIAPNVLSTWVALQNADGDGYEASRTLAMLDLLNVQEADIQGYSIGAHGHHYFLNIIRDPEYALEEVNAQLELDPGNPLIYVSRFAPLVRLHRLESITRDMETATRLADGLGADKWAMPAYLLGISAFSDNDLETSLSYFDHIVELRPDDWFSVMLRGSIHYFRGEYDLARADLERSLELKPNANFPYALLTMIALREARIADAQTLIATVLRDFPDPSFGNRIVAATFGDTTQIVLAPAFSAFGNMTLGQYDKVVEDTEAALAIDDQMVDLHLMQGFAYCTLRDYAAAQAAYTRGIAIDPDFMLLYILRAEAALKQGQMLNALADVAVVRQSAYADAFSDLLEGAMSGQISCENFFNQP